jgi:hypothetical protein
LSRSSKEPASDGLGAPGIPASGGGTGAAGLGVDGGIAGGVVGGAPPGLRPGAVTDGIFPEMSASKIPEAGIGFGETGAAGTGGVEERDGIVGPADGGLAPTIKPGIGGKGGRVEPAGASPEGGLVLVSPVIGGSGAPVEDPAGGLVPTIKPGMGESGAGVVPKGDETPKGAGLAAGEVDITGLISESVILISGITPGVETVETPVDFFVAKVKISFVPISAFSATAVPP